MPRAERPDAVFLIAFGGPEGPDDVLPFLRNVTRGRNVPDARLAHVAKHYDAVGGVSPINRLTRELVAAIRTEMDVRGLQSVPLAWGSRNWHPFAVEGLRPLIDEGGANHLLTVPAAAYDCYSTNGQYREDMACALDELGAAGDVEVDWVPPYWDTPGFLEANARAVAEVLRGADPAATRLLLVTHSIPVAMDDESGPPRYSEQHLAFAEALVPRIREILGGPVPEWQLTYSCRSGPPHQPWLEPSTEDAIRAAAADGASAVCLAPIGFIADHMEVAYDLDVEAAEVAASEGLAYSRAATAGTDPAFVSALVNLIEERLTA